MGLLTSMEKKLWGVQEEQYKGSKTLPCESPYTM